MINPNMVRLDKIVLIADLVNSKAIEDRNQFQIKLKILLESINDRYQVDLLSKFRITRGDEFQAVFHQPNMIFLIIDEINLSLYPNKIRWGIGVGIIDTTSSLLSETELDGPAYAYARKALKELKRYNYYGKSLQRLETKDNCQAASMLNSMLQLQDSLRLSWTLDQSKIVEFLIKEFEYESFVQKDVAASLNLSQQRISNVLAATSFKQYAMSRVHSKVLLDSLTRTL